MLCRTRGCRQDSEVRNKKLVWDQLSDRRTDSHLQGAENARVLHTLVSRQLTETTSEDIEVPQNLRDRGRISVNKTEEIWEEKGSKLQIYRTLQPFHKNLNIVTLAPDLPQ